jgi:DNA-binding NarL/FixJ family response regulator
MTLDTSRSSHPRLLIADDDAVVRWALGLQLGRSFTIVGGARDADEAIELAALHQPDVAIVDVRMPGGGGVRATREIAARAPATAIVALSSDDGDLIVRAMLQAGAVTYVRKGIDARELDPILRSAITAHAGLQAAGAANTPRRPAAEPGWNVPHGTFVRNPGKSRRTAPAPPWATRTP